MLTIGGAGGRVDLEGGRDQVGAIGIVGHSSAILFDRHGERELGRGLDAPVGAERGSGGAGMAREERHEESDEDGSRAQQASSAGRRAPTWLADTGPSGYSHAARCASLASILVMLALSSGPSRHRPMAIASSSASGASAPAAA